MQIDEYIYPNTIEFLPYLVVMDNNFTIIISVEEFPKEVIYGFMENIISYKFREKIVIKVGKIPWNEALPLIQKELSNIETELATQKNKADSVYSKLLIEFESAKALQNDIVSRKTNLFSIFLSLSVDSSSYNELINGYTQLVHELKGMLFKISEKPFETIKSFRYVHTLKEDTKYIHYMDTPAVASLFPFVAKKIMMKGGVLYGINTINGMPIIINRYSFPSYNMSIFGETGSGKSFFTKINFMRERILDPDMAVMIIDPLGEFTDIVNKLGGEVVYLNTDEGIINPLDPRTSWGDIHEKIIQVKALLKTIFTSLNDEDLSSLDKVLFNLYNKYKEPTFSDLLSILKNDDIKLKKILSTFTEGSLAKNNAHTSVSINKNLISFSLKNINPELFSFYITLSLNFIYGAIKKTKGNKIIIIDEAHYMLINESTSWFMEYMSRHVRHYMCGITFVSQNAEDFLSNHYGKTIVNNSYIQLLFRHETVSEKMIDFYGLTAKDRKYILESKGGKNDSYSEALMKVGMERIPLRIISTPMELELG